MKKYALLSTCAVLLLTAANIPLTNLGQFQLLEEVPELPETPFNYANIPLPPYFAMGQISGFDNTPADNPITNHGATLGRVLFYDKNMSINNSISCASCHNQDKAFVDGARFSTGFQSAFTGRNSMGLANTRFYENGKMFWDERAMSVEDQALMPIQDPIEMGMTLEDLVVKLSALDYYGDLFTSAFGSSEVTSDRIAKAIAQFERSMVSVNSKYDVGLQSFDPPIQGAAEPDFPNFTTLENLGKAVFIDSDRGGCAACHGTNNFVGTEARNNGLDLIYEDKGLGDVTGDMGDNGKFKAPSLRNIELTAPYMHDGRFNTLEDVVEHYNSGVEDHPNLHVVLKTAPGPQGEPKQLNLTEEEKAGLVAFLKTLTDSDFMTDERWSNPFVDVIDGVAEVLNVDLQVYPNPIAEQLTIQIDNPENKTYKLRLYSVLGELMYENEMNGTTYQLRNKDWARGIYFLELSDRKSKIVQKIIVQ